MRSLNIRLLFAGLALSLSTQAFAQTNFEILSRPTDSGHGYYVFLNLNVSTIELAHFSAMAKAHGDGLVMIPNRATLNAMAKDNETYINLKCGEGPVPIPAGRHKPRSTRSDCTAIDERLIANADLHPVNICLDLSAALSAIPGQEVHALMFSGHNSDDGFSGDYLAPDTFTHGNIVKVLSDHSTADRILFSKLEFLALWGCDTVTTAETKFYRDALPTLSVIAGFGDTAPAGIRPISGTYLESAIENSGALISVNSKAELMSRINRITGVRTIYAGIWTRTLNAGAFLYRHSSGGTTLDLDTQTCEKFLSERYGHEKQFVTDYFNGVKPLPQDQPGSALRNIYYDLTSHSGCYTHGSLDDKDYKTMLTPTQVGMLRFFDGVKGNFVNVFSADMRADQRETILSAGRAELKQLAATYQFRDPASRKLGMLMERYLVNLDESCMDFLLWHKERTRPPVGNCQLNSNFQWIK